MRRSTSLSAPRLFERRRHRGGVGVVAFVDQQHFAAVDLDQVALAAALQSAHVGEREAGDRDVAADRLDRGEDGQRVRHPMLAALRDGEGQLALEQRGADQAAAAFGRHGMDGMDVGIAAAEGDDAVGLAARGLDQPVAVRRVVGEDRDAVGLQALENLGLGVGDRFFRARDSRYAPGRSR